MSDSLRLDGWYTDHDRATQLATHFVKEFADVALIVRCAAGTFGVLYALRRPAPSIFDRHTWRDRPGGLIDATIVNIIVSKAGTPS